MSEQFGRFLSAVDDFVWGQAMLVLLVGTGVILTVRTGFLPWKNLIFAVRLTFGRKSRKSGRKAGDISPFSALTTSLASTIGTGNIVGVATAMVAGGPGALVWMWLSAAFGLATKFGECMLAVKYRTVNEKGEMAGGPMYTMKAGIKNRRAGAVLGWLFALFTVLASFGIGNMTQGNSISAALFSTFGVPAELTAVIASILVLIIVVQGIRAISAVSAVIVPVMAVFYLALGLIVIAGNIRNLPEGIAMIFRMAFSLRAAGGGLCGSITASMLQSLRFGISRGVFSNEAGMGSAAVTAAAARSDSPVEQGYINMTGTFWDTLVICTVTGLAIACSGVLGTVGPDGAYLDGASLTIAAFSTVLGPPGGCFISVGITLFAFSTILGWEYQGEKAFEYLFRSRRFSLFYRAAFSLAVYVGCTQTLTVVWSFSDIANALMAVPNLICLLLLSREIAADAREYERSKKSVRH